MSRFSLASAADLASLLPSRAAIGRWSRPFIPWVIRVGSLIICLLLWQAASTGKWHFIFRFDHVPPPVEVGRSAAQLLQSPKFFAHIGNSLRRVFFGFLIAGATAVPLGLIIGRFRPARHALLPPIELLRPIPAVAWIPLAILMFSGPEQSMIYITFLGAFYPILLSTVLGVEGLDRRWVDASLTLGANTFSVFREVILPGAMPSIFTGLSIGMGTAWFCLVTAEMISGQFGIGYYTWEAYTLQKYADIILGMATIGLLGMASSFLIGAVGRRLTPWIREGGNRS
jgi:NitT/TauT family transport system permease protein